MKVEIDVPFSESIIDQVVHGKHEAAAASIDGAGSQLPADQARRLAALVRIDENKPAGVAQTDEARRRAYKKNGTWLAYVYTLGVELMDIERWVDAEVALDEVVALSKAKGELYFLDEARLMRALCLKYLGRRREMEALKAEISLDAGAFICRQDLGGCILLRRDHLV